MSHGCQNYDKGQMSHEELKRMKQRAPSELAAPSGSACGHRPEPEMGYTQHCTDALKKRAAWQQQRWCDVCKSYVWDEYWPNESSSETPP